MTGGRNPDLYDAITQLVNTLNKLPDGIASMFHLTLPLGGGGAPPGGPTLGGGASSVPQSKLAGIGEVFKFVSPAVLGAARGLPLGIGKLATSVLAATSALNSLGSMQPWWRHATFTPPGGLAGLVQRFAPLGAGIAGKMGSVLPAGMNLQGFLGRQVASLVTQGLQGSIHKIAMGLGGGMAARFLTPQVASNIQSRLGALQAFVGGRAFQTTFGLQVSSMVGQGLSKFQGLLGAKGSVSPAGFNWVAIGLGMAKGLSIAGAGAGSLGAIIKFAEAQNAANRRFAMVNPGIAMSSAKLEIADFFRTIKLANSTSASAVRLASDINRLRESWLGFDISSRDIGNKAGSFASGIGESVGNYFSTVGLAVKKGLDNNATEATANDWGKWAGRFTTFGFVDWITDAILQRDPAKAKDAAAKAKKDADDKAFNEYWAQSVQGFLAERMKAGWTKKRPPIIRPVPKP